MPSSILSRQSRPPSPPSPTLTYNSTPLARPTHSRRTSTSYTPTVTSGGQQAPKVNVTRLAIEGRARQNGDGVSVKLYLKISLPIDSVTPGATVPLFQEENVKILETQVHPLDSNSVPYYFSSAVVLLNNAARALNLPPASSETFYSAFGVSPSPSASSSRAHNSEADSEPSSPVDPYYAGQILVSNYAISYILPKVFPPRNRAVIDREGASQTTYRSRRASISERNSALFLAAIDMWVPYVSKPPRSPYLLSIPIPRCLHNHIKLRIFPPISTSSSVASLSSVEEDGSTWDLASDPHVARITSNRIARSNSYSQFADDESSDSSQAGLSDGCSIQGTFPSSERIRIRWAKPTKILDIPGGGGGGRRRVGVREVKGEMTCAVQGKYKDPEKNVEGIIMQVTYKGTCKGIWFPGVATLLGMDVGLEAKNSEVSWAPGFQNLWEVGGGVGYTGFDIGHGPSSPNSRASSLDSSLSGVPPPSEQSKSDEQTYSHPSDSTSSLLRVPLPTQNVGEYSFEGSSNESVSVDGASSFPSSMQVSAASTAPKSPDTPITLHLNMNELLPPVQNLFTFTVSGTILLTPRITVVKAGRQGVGVHNANVQPNSEEGTDSEPVVLPRLTVHAADTEVTSIIVRNEAETGAFVLEVYNATGDLKDAQIRKTVLQKGASTKCGDDGGRISLKRIRQHTVEISPRPLTPNGPTHSRLGSSSPLLRAATSLRPKRDGPLIIPAVENRITLFISDARLCYAVRTTLNIPCDTNSEWLEFGLALPRAHKIKGKPPTVSIVNASIEGVPVRIEMASANAADKTVATGIGGSFEQDGHAEWVAWIRMHAGPQGGTHAVIDYVVKGDPLAGKAKQHDSTRLLLLPTFPLPVGRLDGRIYAPLDLSISILDANLAMRQNGEYKCKFLHFSATEFFVPRVSLAVEQKKSAGSTVFISSSLQVLPWLAFFITLFLFQRATIPTQGPSHLSAHLNEHATLPILTNEIITTIPATVTTTMYATVTVTSTDIHTITRTENSATATRTVATSYEPTTTHLETAAASLPFRKLWSIPWLPDKIDTEVVVNKLWGVAEEVWRWLQKAYHYPLDPS